MADHTFVKLGKIEPIEPVFFFEREDGSSFSCKAAEAWATWKKRRTFGFKYIGQSRGQVFHDMLTAEQDRQEKLWASAKTTAKQRSLEQTLQKATLEVIGTAMALELEEARTNQTPPPSQEGTVFGSASPLVAQMLSKMVQ